MLKIKSITAAIALGTALLVLGGCASAPAAATTAPAKATEMKVYRGVGQTPVFRVKTDKTTGAKSYNFSYVTSSALFDKDGKIIDVYFDILEVGQTTPTSKAGAPVFSGWPNGTTVTDETVAKEVAGWQTKLERGDAAYGMNWSVQAAHYQKFFTGKTVDEIEQWYAKNVSDVNGKPLTDKATDPKDKEKYSKLTDAEKKALVDVTSGASISLNDSHGDFVGALKEAYKTKKEVTIK